MTGFRPSLRKCDVFVIFGSSMVAVKNRSPGRSMDERELEALFRQYFPPLMAFARKMLGDEDDAREVVHQVFINLWEKRGDLDLTGSLKPYLFTSVRHRSLNVIRDRKKFTSSEVPEEAGEWDASAGMESRELEEKIGEALGSLPDRCRQVFELSRFDGLKYSEIAERMDISVKTVENQMTKALKLLREKLMKYLAVLLWCLMQPWN